MNQQSPPGVRATLRLAVLGCGKLAREVILPTLPQIPQARVVVVADPDPAAREATVRLAPDATALADWRDAVGSDVDAVIVSLPTGLHAQAAVAVLDAGKHLYLEKPLAATLEEALAVVAAHGHARERGSAPVAMVGFNYRFNPLVVELRRRLASGAIGAPRVVRTIFSTQATPGASWRRPDTPSGGVLLDLGSHHVDLVRAITGDPVVHVSCERTTQAGGREHAAVQMQLAGGCVVQSVFATGAADDDRIEIAGETGVLAMDRYRSLAIAQRGLDVPSRLSAWTAGVRELSAGWHYAVEKRRAPWNEPSFGHALRAFVAAISSGAFDGPGLSDGLQSLRVIDAAQQSAAQGRAVAIAPLEVEVKVNVG